MPWQKVALIGVGLLGGSIGLALRQGRLAHSVVGYVRRPEAIVECQKIGVVDSATTDLQDAVQGADLVILCTPLGQMRDLTAKILPHLNSGAIITDVGSVKHSVHDALEPLCQNAGITFVGSHPMAGSEKMGVTAARVDLFQNALCVITALETTPAPAVQRIEKFWSSLGARILHLSPTVHDTFTARSSHLPHLVAAQLVNLILDPAHPLDQAALCANGFKDATRIASSSPEMWRDISLTNHVELGNALDQFIEALQSFRTTLAAGDAERIGFLFQQAKNRRDAWASQSLLPPPA